MRRIANELGVSLGSVSLWARDVRPLSDRGEQSSRVKGPRPGTASAGLGHETKICGKCRRELPIDRFNRHPTHGHQHWCRDCFRAYFQARGNLHRSQTSAARVRRRTAGRQFIADYLTHHACADCAESDSVVLEFDHTQQKQASVSALVAAGWSIKRLKQEITLCDVVCVNCHRRRTARRGSSWRTDPWALDKKAHLLPGERRNMELIRDTLCAFKCVDCGLRDLLVLEFDHVGPKRGNVIEMARRGCSLMNLERELAMCEIRCANCHRRRTRHLYDLSAHAA
ncbi:MAG: hypothetical protein QOI10_1980 [Solirubrobacterales bacterium]|jgi:hypothetical protein|nr:hypothetical protein [Solirubrobacterales bacterium]